MNEEFERFDDIARTHFKRKLTQDYMLDLLDEDLELTEDVFDEDKLVTLNDYTMAVAQCVSFNALVEIVSSRIAFRIAFEDSDEPIDGMSTNGPGMTRLLEWQLKPDVLQLFGFCVLLRAQMKIPFSVSDIYANVSVLIADESDPRILRVELNYKVDEIQEDLTPLEMIEVNHDAMQLLNTQELNELRNVNGKYFNIPNTNVILSLS